MVDVLLLLNSRSTRQAENAMSLRLLNLTGLGYECTGIPFHIQESSRTWNMTSTGYGPGTRDGYAVHS